MKEEEKVIRVLVEGGQGEIVEKKSRFIATLRRVDSEAEALSFVEEIRKKYWDARHNCFAFVVGRKGELLRFSDDGEPGGTAGRPMLEVLLGENLCNVAVVVTRYFGGVLLGTGGLVRAYTQAVKEGLSHCLLGTEREGCEFTLEVNYGDLGRVQYYLGQQGIAPLESSYTDKVLMRLLIPITECERVQKALTEACSGRILITEEKQYYFVDKD